MTLPQIFALLAALTMLLAYGLYFRQMAKGQSTPNPSSWLIFFLAGVINTLTYFTVVQGNIWQSLFTIVVTLCLLGVLIYSLFKGKFTQIKSLEIVIFLLALGIGVFWQITDNARLSNLLLQVIYVIAYIPTYVDIVKRRTKENYLAWLFDVIAYSFATLVLIVDVPNDWIAFVSPILNGIMCNALVVILIILYKKKKG
jgi:hypothetical protein